MSSVGAILGLVRARLRARPGRAGLTVLGLAVAVAFAGAVAAEGTVAGDHAAGDVLSALSPLDRTVRLTTSDVVTPAIQRQATGLLASLGLRTPIEVVLMNPVRLSGIVVRPAAVQRLSAWTTTPAPAAACRADRCPVLTAGSRLSRTTLEAPGVRFVVAGRTALRSAAPLGFSPTEPADQPPVLLTSDFDRLDALAGLDGVFRTHSWFAPLSIAQLHAWKLAGLERKLRQAQSNLLASGSGLTLTAPFQALESARSQAHAGPQRLLLAGSGAITALLLFLVLAAGAQRRDVAAELGRLRTAGASTLGCGLFLAVETGIVSGAALVIGAGLALGAGAIAAGAAGIAVGPALHHSLLTPTAGLVLIGLWLCMTALVFLLLVVRGSRMADGLAVAAVAALALALSRGTGSGSDPLVIALAPLACLAAGILVYRGAAALLRAAERLIRPGPVMARLALVGLARAPGAPSLAIAFIAVSVGLGAFSFAYRATLERSSADQAANVVPLDATITAGADFASPLALAPLSRWRSIAGGAVAPVRRTEASYVSGGSSVTVPALGVPASTLPQIHGWRRSDAAAPLPRLARRLVPPGRSRIPGPVLAAGVRTIALSAQATGIGVIVTADLRNPAGSIRRITLGQAAPSRSLLRGRVPPGGQWELEALELSEPAGLEITNGHQNGENPAAATRFSGSVTLGPIVAGSARVDIGRWRAIGAAAAPRGQSPAAMHLRFTASGQLGLIRPVQPSDVRPVPVLADPLTAATAGRGHRLALTVDGAPVSARVVGVLRRFPAVAEGTSGFVVADETTLASALDAQAPGQGRPDELWLSTSHPDALRRALAAPPLSQLSVQIRRDVQHRLRTAPISSAVLGTLTAATAVAAVLAIIGLLVALLGAGRDERVESDLVAQGAGPRMLRSELRLRLVLAGVVGVVVGLGIGLLLTRLAVSTVRAAGTVANPEPPIVTVAPWGMLALWGALACCVLAGVVWLATRQIAVRRTS